MRPAPCLHRPAHIVLPIANDFDRRLHSAAVWVMSQRLDFLHRGRLFYGPSQSSELLRRISESFDRILRCGSHD